MLTSENVEHVQDLLDPITYIEVLEQGRQIKIVKTTTDVTKLFPAEYLEATIKNQGKAKLDENNNVVTQEGEPWIGGNPFPRSPVRSSLSLAVWPSRPFPIRRQRVRRPALLF